MNLIKRDARDKGSRPVKVKYIIFLKSEIPVIELPTYAMCMKNIYNKNFFSLEDW